MSRGLGYDGSTPPLPPTMKNLTPEALQQVAQYFQTLAEPTRLHIVNLLRKGELNVGEIADACGCSAANVSRHLSHLMRHGLVEREARGTTVYYRIADESVYALCDLVCNNIARQLEKAVNGQKAFARFGKKAASSR